jgi:hypothetical protein
MKRITTLLIAAFTLSIAAQAQTTEEEARRVVLGQKKDRSKPREDRDAESRRNDGPVYEDNRRNTSGSREAEVDRINREYDYKIQSIRDNNALTREEKQRIITDLNREREKEIRRVNARSRDRDYDDRNDDDDRDKDDDRNKKNKKYKSNRGKHKGWEKGKGNKHRDRDND